MAGCSEALSQHFSSEGFVVVPNLLTENDVNVLKEAIARVLGEVRQESEKAGTDPDAVLASGVWVGLAAKNAVFRRYMGDPRILDVLTAIIGPDIVFLSDKVVFKGRQVDFGTPWHQDWAYWKGSHKVSVWVALDEATVENGCLRIIPGSHRRPLLHTDGVTDGRGFGHRLNGSDLDETSAVAVPLKAGGAVFFHDLTVHSSYPNLSGTDRFAWIPTYKRGGDEDPHYPWAVAAQIIRGAGKFCSRCGALMGGASPSCQ